MRGAHEQPQLYMRCTQYLYTIFIFSAEALILFKSELWKRAPDQELEGSHVVDACWRGSMGAAALFRRRKGPWVQDFPTPADVGCAPARSIHCIAGRRDPPSQPPAEH